MCLFTSALLRARDRAGDPLPDNDNRHLVALAKPDKAAAATAVAERFRHLAVWLIVASLAIDAVLELIVRVRLEPGETYAAQWILAALLTVSLMWWEKKGHRRIADAFGALGIAWVAGMSCGIIAMLELRLHFPMADDALWAMDHALGVDGIRIVEALVRQGQWIFTLMAFAYNYTLPIFFGGIVLLAAFGDRIEAWRASLCFVGTLLTTCIIAVAVPAKGLGMWAPQELLDRLPPRAMRTFWRHFDEFYSGADPVLQLQAVDGVISFPSFHAVVGFLVLAMWRKHILTVIPAAIWLFFMLLATLPGGGHYIVDLIGGFLVWAGWFALSRRIEHRVLGLAMPVDQIGRDRCPGRWGRLVSRSRG